MAQRTQRIPARFLLRHQFLQRRRHQLVPVRQEHRTFRGHAQRSPGHILNKIPRRVVHLHQTLTRGPRTTGRVFHRRSTKDVPAKAAGNFRRRRTILPFLVRNRTAVLISRRGVITHSYKATISRAHRFRLRTERGSVRHCQHLRRYLGRRTGQPLLRRTGLALVILPTLVFPLRFISQEGQRQSSLITRTKVRGPRYRKRKRTATGRRRPLSRRGCRRSSRL